MNQLLFLLLNKLKILTANIPPNIEIKKAKSPPTIIPKVCVLRNDSGVIVAPIDNPKKIVLVFNILSEAAFDNLFVLEPISLIRFPNIKNPTRGVADGTIIETTNVITIGNRILILTRFLISNEFGNFSSCSFIFISISFFVTEYLTIKGIITGTKAI